MGWHCRILLGLSLSLAISLPAQGQVASEPCPVWAISTEALWLHRASGGTIAESFATTGAALDKASLDSSDEPGVRISLRRIDPTGDAWEINYFGLQHWDDNGGVAGDPVNFTALATSPVLRFDDVIGGFDTSVTYQYRARVHNVELNRWWNYDSNSDWNWQVMAGLRFFEFQERLQMTGVDSIFGSEVYSASSYNALIGAQLGIKAERSWDRWSIFGLGKAGIYGNNYQSGVTDTVTANVGFPPPPIASAQQGGRVAGILEAQLGLQYCVNQNISLIGGYTVLYVPGLELQPTSISPGGNEDNDLVLHGASAGVVVSW